MKTKILSLTVAAMAFTTTLSAQMMHREFHVGIMHATIANDPSIGYTFGYGYSAISQGGIYFGSGFDFDRVDMGEGNVYTSGVHLKLGYEVMNKLALYGIGSVMYQNSGGGFGYGIGSEYFLSDSFAIDVEYVTHSIAPDFLKEFAYDYNKASFSVKYLF